MHPGGEAGGGAGGRQPPRGLVCGGYPRQRTGSNGALPPPLPPVSISCYVRWFHGLLLLL